LDLFLPSTYLSSADRARAFLWLVYHYLESHTGPNPFDDHYSARHPGRIPTLRTLSPAEYERENVDTEEEIEWGNAMSHQRNLFLQYLMDDSEKKTKPHAHYVTGVQFLSHFFSCHGFIHFFYIESGNNMPRSQRQLLDEPADERSFLFYVPSQEVYDHKNVGFFGSFE
jgi:Ino eighty subunit 1